MENRKSMTLEEIHEEEIKMVKKFIEFCEINHLTYYFCGGSLLGAIRHKGFIPWDDDIDILMPRPDYERFEDLMKQQGLMLSSNLEVHSFRLNNLNDPFCKIMNLNIDVDKYYVNDEFDNHLWLDVFPMDGLPESEKEVEKIYKKVLFLRRIGVMLKVKSERIKTDSKSLAKRYIKPICRFLLKPLGVKFFIGKINDICLKYDYQSSKYVGGIAFGYGPQEKLERKNVVPVEVEFEGMKVKTFKCWDEYLTNLYGDYMKLPSEDKRVAHIAKMYRKNGDDNNEKK